jgi:hypothetical protein
MPFGFWKTTGGSHGDVVIVIVVQNDASMLQVQETFRPCLVPLVT